MSEMKYGEPWEPDGTGLATDCKGNSLVECDCKIIHIDREYRNRMIVCVNLCAGRTREQIEAAFALYDNREKVVENLYAIASICSPERNRVPSAELAEVNLLKSYHYATAALALLQAEKEGGR